MLQMIFQCKRQLKTIHYMKKSPAVHVVSLYLSAIVSDFPLTLQPEHGANKAASLL